MNKSFDQVRRTTMSTPADADGHAGRAGSNVSQAVVGLQHARGPKGFDDLDDSLIALILSHTCDTPGCLSLSHRVHQLRPYIYRLYYATLPTHPNKVIIENEIRRTCGYTVNDEYWKVRKIDASKLSFAAKFFEEKLIEYNREMGDEFIPSPNMVAMFHMQAQLGNDWIDVYGKVHRKRLVKHIMYKTGCFTEINNKNCGWFYLLHGNLKLKRMKLNFEDITIWSIRGRRCNIVSYIDFDSRPLCIYVNEDVIEKI